MAFQIPAPRTTSEKTVVMTVPQDVYGKLKWLWMGRGRDCVGGAGGAAAFLRLGMKEAGRNDAVFSLLLRNVQYEMAKSDCGKRWD